MSDVGLSPQDPADLGAGGVAVAEKAPEFHLVHLRFASVPNVVRWEDRGRTVSVRLRPQSSTLCSLGPILPIVPLFAPVRMPWNPEIDFHVEGEPGPVRARIEDFALRPTDGSEPLLPTGGCRIPAAAVSELRMMNGTGVTVVELEGERSFRLSYPPEARTVGAADLDVRLASADGSWMFARSVRLVRGRTTYWVTLP